MVPAKQVIIENELGDLPSWDLTHFYVGIDDPKIESNLQDLQRMCLEFRKHYEGKLAGISRRSVCRCF